VLTLTYEYKAMPTNEQIRLIEHTLDLCRKVWNFALRERKDWINSRKCPVNACSIIRKLGRNLVLLGRLYITI
jgi:putative transposase